MSTQGLRADHWVDGKNVPFGGCTSGNGLCISWQRGAIRNPADKKPAAPNGALLGDVIAALADRIKFLQETTSKCPEHEVALQLLDQTQKVLDNRPLHVAWNLPPPADGKEIREIRSSASAAEQVAPGEVKGGEGI